MDVPREPVRKRGRYIWMGLAALAVVAVTVYLARLEPAAPSVDRAAIWTDSVRRGDMVRQVRGPGTLVPERIRIVTALTAGRVEIIHVEPGEEVDAGTILVEMSNPDVQLESLDAQRQLSVVQAELLNLRSSLETQRLNQEAVVATVRAEYRDAMRQVEADRQLAERNLISRMELATSEDRAQELRERIRVEERRLEIASESMPGQLTVQENQVERLEAIARFQDERRTSMRVPAGAGGVLQELPLQVGQWAMAGQELARVVEPGRLKAVLRVPETQARDLAVGQAAAIDTRNGIAQGRVSRIDPAVQAGAVTVDVSLGQDLPQGARPDLSVDGTIEIERLEETLYVGRPAYGQSGGQISLFRLEPDGRAAVRVMVRLGRTSVNTVEIVEGLQPGDVVILSDMSQWDGYDRVRLN
ncbi:MAG: HlyD family efflux transporter periplasmic adaptor subunit [Gemmatimonadota bacterium]